MGCHLSINAFLSASVLKHSGGAGSLIAVGSSGGFSVSPVSSDVGVVVGVGVGVSTFSGGGHFFSQSSSSFKSLAIFSLRITCALFPLFPFSFASLAEFSCCFF